MLSDLKELLRAIPGLSPDVLRLLLGLGLYVATCFVAGRGLGWAWALVPGLSLAVLIEAVEVVDHYGTRVLLESGAREMLTIGLRHGRDVAVMNAIPVMVVVVVNLLSRTSAD